MDCLFLKVFVKSLRSVINVLLIFKGVNEIASLVTHSLLIFIGMRELKVRQIDHNIILGW
jgi:hypothetical protein